MSLPPKPKSRPVILRTLLAGALAAGSLVACGDDDGGPAIDARQTQDGPIAPQPPPRDAEAIDAEAVDAEAVDAEASGDAQLP
jgi:hypothetical protein